MKSVKVSVTVPQSREEVYDLLDLPGPADCLDMEVVAVDRPRMSFELASLEAPPSERLAAPLTRGVVRRNNQRSLCRLAEKLGERSRTGGDVT